MREVAPDSTVPCYPSPGIPEPPEYLPEMKDAIISKNTTQALSPRIAAVHGPTKTGTSTVFPLAITHWAENAEGLKRGLTVCAQPRRILAQQLCDRVRTNREMWYNYRKVGYMIARESSRDSSTKLLYCTEAIVALMMQARLMSTAPVQSQDEITTVVIDEVHNRSADGDYVLALTPQKIRLFGSRLACSVLIILGQFLLHASWLAHAVPPYLLISSCDTLHAYIQVKNPKK